MLGPSRNMIPTAMTKIWLILIILLPLLGIFVNYLLRGRHTQHIKFVLCTLLKCYVEAFFWGGAGCVGTAPVGGCCSDRILGTLYAFYGLAMNVTLMSSQLIPQAQSQQRSAENKEQKRVRKESRESECCPAIA